jgi:transposase
MEKARAIVRLVPAPKAKEVPLEQHTKKFIGIDVAAEEFTVTLFNTPDQPMITKKSIINTDEGFKLLSSWLKEQGASGCNSIICMESTGVYGENLIHYLIAQGFSVAVEPPLKVKRAFDTSGHKNDSVDSCQIAEYAYRFRDELKIFRPRPESIERLKHFLTIREQLTKQSVAAQNAISAYRKHPIQEPAIIVIQEQNLSQIKEHIATVDKHIKQIIQQDPSLRQLSQLLVSLCGVGLLLAAYLLVLTNAFQDITNYKQMAAFLGICPFEFTSGKSILKKSRSRHYGPGYARKLLHLAARSVISHEPYFKKYYLRKLEEGKSKRIVINNIANKLLKISFALIKSKQNYIKGYRSINPMLLKYA